MPFGRQRQNRDKTVTRSLTRHPGRAWVPAAAGWLDHQRPEIRSLYWREYFQPDAASPVRRTRRERRQTQSPMRPRRDRASAGGNTFIPNSRRSRLRLSSRKPAAQSRSQGKSQAPSRRVAMEDPMQGFGQCQRGERLFENSVGTVVRHGRFAG